MKSRKFSLTVLVVAILFLILPASAQDSVNSVINNPLPEPGDSGVKIITP